MRNFEYIRLNYALLQMYDGRLLLAKVMDGSFASSAWLKGDEEFSQIVGRKFDVIIGDDCEQYVVDKSAAIRISSMDEFNSHLKNACNLFKELVSSDLNGEEVCVNIDSYKMSLQLHEKFNTKCKPSLFYSVVSVEYCNSKYIGRKDEIKIIDGKQTILNTKEYFCVDTIGEAAVEILQCIDNLFINNMKDILNNLHNGQPWSVLL